MKLNCLKIVETMKLHFNTFFLFTVICFIGCSERDAGDESFQILDLETAIDSPRIFDLSEISPEIDFIHLDDTQREGLIGEIESLDESETWFYVHDDWEMPVKVFDKQGKFISKRGQIGRGPNEVLEIANIAVDSGTDNLYVNGGQVAYDAEGRMFARNDSVSTATHIAYINGQLVASRGGYRHWDRAPLRKITFLTLYSPDLKREGIIEVFDKGSNTSAINFGEGRMAFVDFVSDIISNNGETLLVKEGRSDTVFYYTGGQRTLQPAFYLDLGKKAISDEIFNGAQGLDIEEGHHAVINIIEGREYVFVTTGEIGKRDLCYLIFDKRNPSDGFTATGPDGKRGLFIGGISFKPMYIRDNRLVGYMQALDIVDNAAGITDPKLKALAATLREDSNPVIVVAKLKQ